LPEIIDWTLAAKIILRHQYTVSSLLLRIGFAAVVIVHMNLQRFIFVACQTDMSENRRYNIVKRLCYN
jgi:hypothetical protein